MRSRRYSGGEAVSRNNYAVDDEPNASPSFSGRTTNRIMPRQVVNLILGYVIASETSLFHNSDKDGVSPNNNMVCDPYCYSNLHQLFFLRYITNIF